MIKIIDGGVTSPKGFLAGGIHAGIRKNKEKKDLAVILCEKRCISAAVYTENLVKGSPILVTQKNLSDNMAQAVICNSGNANTCNADGMEKALQMCTITGEALGILPSDVIVASTGVIGQVLPIEPFYNVQDKMKDMLSIQGASSAAEAILTTDTFTKEMAVTFEIENTTYTIGGMAKGSGMIHPNMATMLCFLTTDVPITSNALHEALKLAVQDTFNMVSVDGDTSTNDMVSIMASGLAGGTEIKEQTSAYDMFLTALTLLCTKLTRLVAKDGEGATKLLECIVDGAGDKQVARAVAKAVICSSLVKAAMFGADANWGRILCAVGYAGVPVDISKVDVSFESNGITIPVCKKGAGTVFSEEKAKEILENSEIIIHVFLNAGNVSATAYGCDLTYDYVKINGDYRT